MLRNIIGQIFSSTFSHFWPLFPFSKYAQSPIFIGGFSQNNIFVAHTSKGETPHFDPPDGSQETTPNVYASQETPAIDDIVGPNIISILVDKLCPTVVNDDE